MDTSFACHRVRVESTIEDILVLYAADSMTALDKNFCQHVDWNQAAIKTAYELGKNLGTLYEDIAFDIPCLDIALEQGRNDRIQSTQKIFTGISFTEKNTSFQMGR
ncbi:MAG: hypothetical protein OXD32_08450 [Endozoicomonadaceae bacterium]|nr:hypothetical protein [Endozoicomonadaceae bacterium]MCY4328881.1 hypothetical protein [Endozoicomonadaceae bacterium]